MAFRDKENTPQSPARKERRFKEIYPKCHALLSQKDQTNLEGLVKDASSPEQLEIGLRKLAGTGDVPPYVPDLARVEAAVHRKREGKGESEGPPDGIVVNPTLEILEVHWDHLADVVLSGSGVPNPFPGEVEEMLLVWRDLPSGAVRVEAASEETLLSLKIAIEGLDPVAIAREGSIPVGALDRCLDNAVSRGLLLRPPSKIERPGSHFAANRSLEEQYKTAEVFTLQWHVTQVCDLHCRHCYDRSDRSPLQYDQAISILDDVRAFCRSRYVRGQVTFTGGNPLLYPRFDDLYRAAAERGLATGILGNPTSRERLEDLIRIQPPVFFQVSLEGMREHNDFIRGKGFFDRVMAFLEILRELRIRSMVMLTLTRENMKEVLPLAEILRNKVDSFTFNRLSMVGEGAHLQLPTREAYAAFLEDYIAASEENPILAFKDNLINIPLHRDGLPLTGGCAGFGCSAAFNFMTVLPDGEVHACRKFPSYIGNIFEQDLSTLYDSEIARRYRAGSAACGSCEIRPVCGGCLASTYCHGLDIFEDRDPLCFKMFDSRAPIH